MQRPLAKPGTGDSLLYRVFCRDEMQSFCIAFLSLQKITSGSRKDTIGNESMTGCGPPGAGRPARRRSIGRWHRAAAAFPARVDPPKNM